MKAYSSLLLLIVVFLLAACQSPAAPGFTSTVQSNASSSLLPTDKITIRSAPPTTTPPLLTSTPRTSPTLARTVPQMELETIPSSPTPTSTAVPTAIPTSSVIPGWLVYRNKVNPYELSYPPEAKLSSQGADSVPDGDLPVGKTLDEYMQELRAAYPDGLCTTVDVGVGYLTIQVPDERGGKYIGFCGVTGVGDYDVSCTTEKVSANGKTYTAQLYQIHERNPEATFREEFAWVQLEDGTRIGYAGYWVDRGKTYQDYLPDKKVLLQILSTYQTLPTATPEQLGNDSP